MAISFCSKRMILTRNTIYKTQKRKNGYIILLPEIGEDLPDKDSLLRVNDFPEFNTFSVKRAVAAVGKLSVLFEEGVQKVAENIDGKENIDIINDVLNPLEELSLPIETTWGVAKTLYFGNQNLMPVKYYEKIHKRLGRARAEKFINKSIYKACKDVLLKQDLNLTSEQQRIIEKHVLEGHLNALDVENEKDSDRFHFLNLKIAEKSEKMKERVESSTSSFKSTIKNQNVVADFPEKFLREIAQDPNNPRHGPWKITLQSHIISQFLEYCPDRDLRFIAWKANVERSGMVGDDLLRTSTLLEDLRDHRIEYAKKLGYKSYSHLSMETKMAGGLNNIYQVMDNLLKVARPAQEKEIEELTKFSCDRGFEDKIIRQWDIAFWMRKQQRSVLNFRDEILHQYFPLPHVLNGLFQLIENLFSVRFVERQKVEVWHPDVKFFDVIDLTSSTDEPIAHFYFDPYDRGNEKIKSIDSAWMLTVRAKSTIASTTPWTSMIFNFQPPVDGVPSLLSFKDVANLFEKFGGALQYLLTRVNYSTVAGASTVEWDAVDISSYFMRNWAYEPRIIQSIATHYKTNEPIPDEYIESISKIRLHMAGYKLCETLYYGRFDLELHELSDFWVPIMERLWKQHFVIPQSKFDSSITSWVDVFCGGLAASHYCRFWSELVAADIYSAFEELENNNENQVKETAMRFRDTFLSLGGSIPANEIFRRFRGRDPNSQPLIKILGLQSKNNDSVEQI